MKTKRNRPHGSGHLTRGLKKHTWYAKFYITTGVRRSITIHAKTEADANRILQSKIAAVEKEGVRALNGDRQTVDAVLRCLEDYNRNRNRPEPRGLKKLREFFVNVRASKVTAGVLESYANWRKSADPKLSTTTINRNFATLRRAFRISGIAWPREFEFFSEKDNARQGFFEREEYETIRKYLPDEVQVLCDVAYITGMRRGELLKLKWEHIDFKNERINLEPKNTKNRLARFFPFAIDSLGEILKKHYEKTHGKVIRRDVEYVFHRDGERIKDFRGAWDAAKEEAYKETKEGRYKEKLFHDFRRTAVRNLVRGGFSQREAMFLSGHRTANVFERYNIMAESDITAAVSRYRAKKNGPKMVENGVSVEG